MYRSAFFIASLCIGVAFVATATRPVGVLSAQTPACRQGSTQTQQEADQRRIAINLMRGINTEQAAFAVRNGRYATAEDLAASRALLPAGLFSTRVVATEKQYSVLIRDTSDPCGYTLFSDQTGVIFVGAPMS